jgi:hypothetical protein
MDEPLPNDLQQLLNRFPDAEPRSKLAHYWPVIREWRRRKKTYREIRKNLILAGGFKTLSIDTLYHFIKRRSRPRKAEVVEPETATPTAATSLQQTDFNCQPKLSAEELKARREKARASNHKPLFGTPGNGVENEPVTFDLGKPRVNQNLLKKRDK